MTVSLIDGGNTNWEEEFNHEHHIDTSQQQTLLQSVVFYTPRHIENLTHSVMVIVGEWVSDSCLTPNDHEQYFNYIMSGARYILIWWWWCSLYTRPTHWVL